MSCMPNISTTKHEVVHQQLVSQIRSQRYKVGTRLDGENKLAESFGVSRGTIRSVLEKMTREGLLNKVPGSGTYVNDISGNAKPIVCIPVGFPTKPLVKHFLGRLRQLSHEYGNVDLQIDFHKPATWSDLIHWVRRLFTGEKAAALYEVTINDLHWLVREALCADLTAAFGAWSQRDNLYDIARQAVTYNGRVYAFPFHAGLSTLSYNRRVLGGLDIDTEAAVNSLDGLVRTMEKLKNSGRFEYTFWPVTVRSFLQHLLRAFYSDLYGRFSQHPNDEIERDIAVEVLGLIRRMKWDLDALFPPKYHEADLQRHCRGEIPLSIGGVSPKAFYRSKGAKDGADIGHLPFRFGRGRKAFAFYNSYVWIVNPLIPDESQQFVAKFLQEYVHPDTEYEIDVRYLEENQINSRSTSFKNVRPRVPRDDTYAENLSVHLNIAELEIPFPCPSFDNFMSAALRVIMDERADPAKEYEFYCSMPMAVSAVQNGITLKGVLG